MAATGYLQVAMAGFTLAAGARHGACGRTLATVGLALPLIWIGTVGCGRTPHTLETDPPGVTVWSGDTILGRSPLVLPENLPLPATLRLSLPGCIDQVIVYDPVQADADGVSRVTLARSGGLSLRCESVPSGAHVYVDGEFRGRTPLDLRQLERRPIELVLMMTNRESVSKTIDLTIGDPVGGITIELPSLTERYYRQQLEKEPTNIHHYCDLAHHYMLEHRFEEAMGIFADAVSMLVSNPGLADAARLWAEIQGVTVEQYNYGNADDVTTARKALRDRFAALLAAHVSAPFPELHVNYIMVLDRLDERQKAQEAFEIAWRRFPNDQALNPLQKKGFATP